MTSFPLFSSLPGICLLSLSGSSGARIINVAPTSGQKLETAGKLEYYGVKRRLCVDEEDMESFP